MTVRLFLLQKETTGDLIFNYTTMSFYVNSVNDNVTCTINSHFYVKCVQLHLL